MSIVGIMVARNEADIIGQSLHAAANQLDAVLVVDCGSEDDTLKEAIQASQRNRNLAVLPPLPPALPEAVRRHVWAAVRDAVAPTDWFIILDADEFLDPHLRPTLQGAVREGADHVFSAHVNFYYTRREAASWRKGEETIRDRSRPIQERRRFYCMQTSMPRAWRNNRWLRWNRDTYMPEGLCRPSKERLIFFHYQYRDLPQIEVRIQTRNSINPNSDLAKSNPHWLLRGIEEVLSADDDPRLRLFEPGCPPQPDPELGPVPHVPNWKACLKQVVARACAFRRPQEPSQLFCPEEARDALRSALR